jgi:hypothetical protein
MQLMISNVRVKEFVEREAIAYCSYGNTTVNVRGSIQWVKNNNIPAFISSTFSKYIHVSKVSYIYIYIYSSNLKNKIREIIN